MKFIPVFVMLLLFVTACAARNPNETLRAQVQPTKTPAPQVRFANYGSQLKLLPGNCWVKKTVGEILNLEEVTFISGKSLGVGNLKVLNVNKDGIFFENYPEMLYFGDMLFVENQGKFTPIFLLQNIDSNLKSVTFAAIDGGASFKCNNH